MGKDIPGIHHVQIAIPMGGEEAARAFYGELLGFPEIPKPGSLRRRGGLWFRTANLDLHLGVDPSFAPATKAHVAFLCQDLESLRSRLVKAGCTIVDDEELTGYTRWYSFDPFGNRVELLERAQE